MAIAVDDATAMRAAIAAAATVRTSTAPNPWVGAVVVSGDGSIVATGATAAARRAARRAGGARRGR